MDPLILTSLGFTLRTKRRLRYFVRLQCASRDHVSCLVRLDFLYFSPTILARDNDKLQPDAMMHQRCPSAGIFPDAESCKAARSASSSLVDLRYRSDWQPFRVFRSGYLEIAHVFQRRNGRRNTDKRAKDLISLEWRFSRLIFSGLGLYRDATGDFKLKFILELLSIYI